MMAPARETNVDPRQGDLLEFLDAETDAGDDDERG
jgi:hypothetical protein